jgi:hypothetical protein
MLLTSEFSAAFRLTKKWHLLAQTGHAAVNRQYSGVATSPIAFATTDASGRNSHYLRRGMRFWLTETLRFGRVDRVRGNVRSSLAVRLGARPGDARHVRDRRSFSLSVDARIGNTSGGIIFWIFTHSYNPLGLPTFYNEAHFHVAM